MNFFYSIRRTSRRLRNKSIPLGMAVVDEAPEVLDRETLYLLGVGQNPWAAVFACPCGCTARIELNLLAQARPYWKFRTHWDSTVSLWPSIDRMAGCRSHFWFRRGLAEWVKPKTN
jgi:hypothetical protein